VYLNLGIFQRTGGTGSHRRGRVFRRGYPALTLQRRAGSLGPLWAHLALNATRFQEVFIRCQHTIQLLDAKCGSRRTLGMSGLFPVRTPKIHSNI
jgi:hypothetical protein